MYQALYRKWRPKTFSDVIGQAHITDTLQKQVAEGKVGHAYLFTGTRGTGKTTCARILAKAVNCLNPVNGAPCNQCEACRGIDDGSLLDVTELDAASNNGVDNVRALREEAVYTPAVLKKRVYIIDEVHMLSPQAFNALLKTLEEPPEHLLFILATTELHKVPATILSRCQRFSFKRITPQDIESRLCYVAKAEKIDLQPEGAEILARMAGGALRDALSLLDQCRVIQGTIGGREVLDVLGLAGTIQTAQLMRLILQRQTEDALLLFGQLYDSGKDVGALLGELSDLARDLTILSTAPTGGSSLLTGGYDLKTLQSLSQGVSPRRFLYITSAISSCTASLNISLHPRTEGELCLLRLCDESLSGDLDALCARIDRLEKAVKTGNFSAAPSESVKGFRPSKPVKPSISAPAPVEYVPAPEEPPLPEEPPFPEESSARQRVYDIPADMSPQPHQQQSRPPVSPAAAPNPRSPAPASGSSAPASATVDSSSAAGDSAVWSQLSDQYKGRMTVDKRVFLNMATGILSGDLLTVWCQNDFIKSALDTAAVTEVLREVTAGKVGRSIRVAFAIGKPEVTASQAVPVMAAAQKSDAMAELVKKGSQFSNFKIQ
ncbi:MAG: DNA polymerase III subunit gamma/tau [Clostridiales bacterium]|nr:DNA polymerase III subunit gamma/tau [Clostridiales bacterium]